MKQMYVIQEQKITQGQATTQHFSGR